MLTPFSSRLRYVDADAVDDTLIDFDDLNVRAADGEKLGEVEGFIIDPELRRAYYIVVDSGGWFSSRHYLVPIGHARVDREQNARSGSTSAATLSRAIPSSIRISSRR
ncbi:MAG: PRC-barrel domain-containing protein [Vicinamibacterales bacterium]